VLQSCGVVLGVVVALYLVGRGTAELFLLHYSHPSSYSHAWGGPTLAGVLAVHTGPGVVIVAGTSIFLWQRHRHGLSRKAHR
jgi:hypothetical protein